LGNEVTTLENAGGKAFWPERNPAPALLKRANSRNRRAAKVASLIGQMSSFNRTLELAAARETTRSASLARPDFRFFSLRRR